MREIPLTQGYVAFVDDEDYERVSQFKWCALVRSQERTAIYAARNSGASGHKTTILMHRFILGCKERVDHEDRNGLNNQRYNLRTATGSQNCGNQAKKRRAGGSASPFKGVTRYRYAGKNWQVKISENGRQVQVGYFKEECDAALAYNFKAVEVFGEFARFNEPMERAV